MLMLLCFNSFAQNHKSQIETFRKQYMADFLKDKHSPLKQEDLQYLRFYDADSTYSVTAKADFVVNPTVFVIPTFAGTGANYIKFAILTMVVKGKTIQLSVYKDIAFANNAALKDYIFLPFTDETNGKETYGGGRDIDLRENDFKNNTVVIDFNKAYNPYCAFSSGYSCPKPPDENQLQIAITAGEKKYGKLH